MDIMVIILAMLFLVLLLILFFLFTPLIISINTEEKLYEVRLKGVLRLHFRFEGDLFQVKGTLFFIPFTIRTFKAKQKKDKESKRGLKNLYAKLAELKSAPTLPRYAFKVLKTFNVRYLRANFEQNHRYQNSP